MDRRYFQPTTVEEALGVLAEHGEGIDVVAGGTDLVVGARSGKRPLGPALLAIHEVYELRGISERPDGGLHARALATHADLEEHPIIRARYSALSDAAALVGSPATRCAGTLGGNLANASPAMECGSPLLVFDASVELVSRRGRRDVPVADFLRGPGQSARDPDELVIGVVIPPLPQEPCGSAYVRLEYRQAMEIAVVGAAALISLDGDGRIAEARLALTAVAPVCLRAPEAERILVGAEATPEVIAEAAATAARSAKPIDDLRGSAAYRSAMIPVIARRAIERARARALETA
jgi:aerobic carbon-monoxide dehydrogenase medium subunit